MSWWIPILIFTSQSAVKQPDAVRIAEARAVRFLSREVPAWFKDNGCYSCHNNGDAARALFAASRKGYTIPRSVLSDTLKWLSNPQRWDQNKGDPAFSDKTLSDVQFAVAAASAVKHGFVKESAMRKAAARLREAQNTSGAWVIDTGAQPGSPTTYGTTLATYLSWAALRDSPAGTKADGFLRFVRVSRPRSLVDRAARLLFETDRQPLSARAWKLAGPILSGQTRQGGWGPYPDSPPEVFDTALAMLALARIRNRPEIESSIQHGREFLAKEQNSDGSWPETTRPSGGESYAQRISTTGWALLALLETRPQRTRNGSRTASEVKRR